MTFFEVWISHFGSCDMIGSMQMDYFQYDCVSKWTQPSIDGTYNWTFVMLKDMVAAQSLENDAFRCSVYESTSKRSKYDTDSSSFRMAISDSVECAGLIEKLENPPKKNSKTAPGQLGSNDGIQMLLLPLESSNLVRKPRHAVDDKPADATYDMNPDPMDAGCRFPDWMQGMWTDLNVDMSVLSYAQVTVVEESVLEADAVTEAGNYKVMNKRSLKSSDERIKSIKKREAEPQSGVENLEMLAQQILFGNMDKKNTITKEMVNQRVPYKSHRDHQIDTADRDNRYNNDQNEKKETENKKWNKSSSRHSRSPCWSNVFGIGNPEVTPPETTTPVKMTTVPYYLHRDYPMDPAIRYDQYNNPFNTKKEFENRRKRSISSPIKKRSAEADPGAFELWETIKDISGIRVPDPNWSTVSPAPVKVSTGPNYKQRDYEMYLAAVVNRRNDPFNKKKEFEGMPKKRSISSPIKKRSAEADPGAFELWETIKDVSGIRVPDPNWSTVSPAPVKVSTGLINKQRDYEMDPAAVFNRRNDPFNKKKEFEDMPRKTSISSRVKKRSAEANPDVSELWEKIKEVFGIGVPDPNWSTVSPAPVKLSTVPYNKQRDYEMDPAAVFNRRNDPFNKKKEFEDRRKREINNYEQNKIIQEINRLRMIDGQPHFPLRIRERRSTNQEQIINNFQWRCIRPVHNRDTKNDNDQFLVFGGRSNTGHIQMTDGPNNENVTDVKDDETSSYACLRVKSHGKNVMEFAVTGVGKYTKQESSVDGLASELCGKKSNEKKRKRKWMTVARKLANELQPVTCPVLPGMVFVGKIPAPSPAEASGDSPKQLCAKLVSMADDCTSGQPGSDDRMRFTISECVDQDLPGAPPKIVNSEPNEDNEYQCLGMWSEVQNITDIYGKPITFTYVYTKRLNPRLPGTNEYDCFVGTTIPNDMGTSEFNVTSTMMMTTAGTGTECSRLADPFSSGIKMVGVKTPTGTCAPPAGTASASTTGGTWYPLKPQQIPQPPGAPEPSSGGRWYAGAPVPVAAPSPPLPPSPPTRPPMLTGRHTGGNGNRRQQNNGGGNRQTESGADRSAHLNVLLVLFSAVILGAFGM